MITIRTNSTGIETLLNLSIPLLTPKYTIKAVKKRKTIMHTSGHHVEDEKVPNMAVTDSALSGWNWSARALHKNAKDQPPTTL